MNTRSAPGERAASRTDAHRWIEEIVASIPRGSVASYGQIAARAGLACGARLVGRVLANCADDLPWHRVVNAAGRISFPRHSAGYRAQVSRLRAEGIPVESGRIPPRLWRARSAAMTLDALLWGPKGGHDISKGVSKGVSLSRRA